MIFHQLFEAESSTYTYLLADKESKEAIMIDPVLETVDRDLKLLTELGLKLKYILDTHVHADHITGAGLLREKTGAKTGVSANAKVACVDIPLTQGQVLKFGSHELKVIETLGHTNTCMSFLCEERLFTGDSLLIRGCGRTDFQQGSNEKMFHSVREVLFKLPEDTIVFPGHDYRGFTRSSIKEEKEFNPRLNEKVSFEEFQKTMSELKLAHPKKIHMALPANLACGLKSEKEERIFHPQKVDGVPEISCEDLNITLKSNPAALEKIKLIDVRRPDEYVGEYGHIAGAKLVTLGEELEAYLKSEDKNSEIVFICRSGGRSGNATRIAQGIGFTKTINMTGGMIRWTQLGYIVEDKNLT
ncbi:MAG: MBL fold metallo-hydrolase [Bdellovibrionaceae bacterium]|nr:MBL fold metallo-hydrolase [Pseudobdellovibrionaceae bacterium]